MQRSSGEGPLALFHRPVQQWFRAAFGEPTPAQAQAWPEIAAGRSTLLLAPTGSGKTLAAFLAALDRLVFSPEPEPVRRCRVLYISPLKALGADVERNLRAPLAGIAGVADQLGEARRNVSVGVRSGDTSQIERAQLARTPPDIYITTPESLYLLLTSNAREALNAVEVVIVDEIHAIAPTKRGSHLFLSLERLEAQRRRADAAAPPLQRIGLSATQRPLDEVARLLAGGDVDHQGLWHPRPVAIVAPPSEKAWDLTIEVPVEDMAKLGQGRLGDGTGPEDMSSEAGPQGQEDPLAGVPSGSAAGAGARSIWPSIVPRLVERIRAHRSTMIFCNSRRLAERLSAAINEQAGEELALAHHGSVARDRRQIIEERLKRGELPAIVATSSLELGIDIGAVDLVIQIESPPSVSSGIQRIGRAGHQVGAVSRGVIFPKFRGDLLACAAAAPQMKAGEVEAIAYPRNPLDVLAQQIVAAVAMDDQEIDDLWKLCRRAAPFAELPLSSFEGVLDMLSGRYPSDEFAELRPRITWDRIAGTLRARQGARRLAVVSGGTIPDRGLYGVFLAGEPGTTMRRVGELDEEMVFESRAGDVFLLGASSWRIEDITPDRVIVSPAPGQPGKMPFWRGDQAGRPAAFGRVIGKLTRELGGLTPAAARRRLTRDHGLDERAAQNLVTYLAEQKSATGELPSDTTIVVERWLDELGDWRVCVLSPFGARVHAPWLTAVLARLREARGVTVEGLWSDDGMVFRFPEAEAPPETEPLLPAPDEVEDLVVRHLGETAVFAARFRENAARALLLPRRYPGRRSPLWAQRQRAADLLAVASRFGSFPILLETYRECLREVFDVPALIEILRQVRSRQVRVLTVDSRRPSPFAGSLLFTYVANFLYDGDAPLAERRAQALSVDPDQLRALLGEASLRDLLDADAITEVELALQRLGGRRPATSADGLHDLLLALGDLGAAELAERSQPPEAAAGWLAQLAAERRVVAFVPPGLAALAQGFEETGPDAQVLEDRHAKTGRKKQGAKGRSKGTGDAGAKDMAGGSGPEGQGGAGMSARTEERRDPLAGLRRWAAAEDAGRLRDALGVPPAPWLPRALLEPVADPLGDLVSRYARTHGPFSLEALAQRLGLGPGPVRAALERLAEAGRVVAGEFTPGRRGAEWCDAEVLRQIKRRSLAKLRREVEPAPQSAYARFLLQWQNIRRRRAGVEALMSTIEQLQGAPLLASALETEILPARIEGYRPGDLDALCAAGEVVWAGLEAVGPSDGRIALYLADQYPLLCRPPRAAEGELAGKLRALLRRRGALFFSDITALTGAFPQDLLQALWDLVWAGEATNDTLSALRKVVHGSASERRRGPPPRPAYRLRRLGPPGSEGRWSLLPDLWGGLKEQVAQGMLEETAASPPDETARRAALVRSLLERHGVLTREAVHAEEIAGGFSAVYEVLKAMEEAGRARRGYFVEGLGAAQFALVGAEDRLRALRDPPEHPEAAVLASTDPANPYGAALPWPERPGVRTARSAHTQVVLVDGALAAYVGKDARTVALFLPDAEPERGRTALAAARALAELVSPLRRTLLIGQLDGEDASASPLRPVFEQAGFHATGQGLFLRWQGVGREPEPDPELEAADDA